MSSDLTKQPVSKQPAERAAGDFYLDVERRSIGDAFTAYFTRLRTGEPGALPSVLGLIVLIRIVLSFSLEVEIDGTWPWSRWRLGRTTAPGTGASADAPT